MLASVKAEMSRRKETNATMAKLLGMAANSFSFKINEKREFTLSELAAMAKHFGCTIDYLVEDSEAQRVCSDGKAG